MKRIFIVYLLVFSFIDSRSADPKFPVSEIPDVLKKDVNVVVREDKMIYQILSDSKGKVYSYFVVTIFNESGKKFASQVLDYNKLTKVTELKASVFDANGKLIKKLKNSEVYDQSAFDGYSLYSDNRLKVIDLSQGFYPYTVEIEYTKEYNFLFFIDGSTFIPGEKVSVQHASYQLLYPPSLTPRYKTANIDTAPKKGKTTDGFESLTWTLENLSSITIEPFSSKTSFIPYVEAAPTTFSFDRYPGDMSSWDNFGKWIISLNKGKNILPEKTIAKIKELTEKATSKEEKVKIIYEYLQSKTRYVSIQLGIGGFQPFEASLVDQNGYGDCKALSNYMVSLLEGIGIKSHYVLIRAGRGEKDLDINFPSSQFNHAIVAVPNEKDTIWLECTSQTNPFGYQGSFTGDRKALLITEDGGKIVNTTKYPTEKNTLSRSADVYVNGTDAKASIKTIYSGLQYENNNLDVVLEDSYDKQKEWLHNNIQIPTFDIVSFSMKNHKNRIPSAVVKLDLNLRKHATVGGKRIFITPNLMNRSSYIPEKFEDRKTDVILNRTYIHFDTIKYHLPEDIYPESIPEPVSLKTVFGEYENGFTVNQSVLVYTRKLRMEKGRFKAESYNELVEFYRNINKADNAKVVFLNKT